MNIMVHRALSIVSVALVAMLLSIANAHAAAEPQLLIFGAEIDCDATPPLITLHGDFGSDPGQLVVTLDTGDPMGLVELTPAIMAHPLRSSWNSQGAATL